MKVNIVVEPDLEEEYVELHVKGITDEISRLSEIIQSKSQVITGTDEYERIVVIDDIFVHFRCELGVVHSSSFGDRCIEVACDRLPSVFESPTCHHHIVAQNDI